LNHSPKKLEKKVGEAAVSRLIEICDGVELKGCDYSIEKRLGEL
jgi:DNA replication protein DnaC